MVKVPLKPLVSASWPIGRAHAIVCALTIVLVALSGIVLRIHHANMPAGPFLENEVYALTLRVHGALDGAMVALPLLVLVGATVALPRWYGRRRFDRLDVLALAAHVVALGAWTWSLGRGGVDLVERQAREAPATIALLVAMTAQALAVGREMLRGPWSRSPLAWTILVVAVIAYFPSITKDTVVAFAAVGWGAELASHRAATDRVLGVMIALASGTWLVLRERLTTIHLADTLADVGALHLVEGVALMGAGLALLRPAHVPSLVRVVMCIVPLAAMAVIELVLGELGIARRYWRTELPEPYGLVMNVLIAVTVAALAWTLATWWRAPPPPETGAFD